MSRSRLKQPFAGNAVNHGEKYDKQIASRRLRHGNKMRLRAGRHLRIAREVSDPWCMMKDGKSRFDPISRPDMMRK